MANPILSAAASSSMASSSASTSCTPWDVFVNHRGPDGKMAARYLYRRLTSNGLRRVFFDKEEMKKAQSIPRQIIEAIRGASLHIAIFSPRYAQSWWCLEELVLMLHSGRPILPVFYKVNSSVVRHNVKDGAYADALRVLANKTDEGKPRYCSNTIDQWRDALSSVADLSGFAIRDETDEFEQLDEVVEKVLKMVPKPLMHVAKHPTGLDLKVVEFENFEKMVLSNQQGCKVVGIVGVGGVGKTTLAIEIFNRRRSDYTKSSFLLDARQHPITVLQTKLLEAFLGKQKRKIENGAEGLGILLKYLESFQGLIVVDDIDHASQLDAILPIRNILSPESLILVTSRDKHVLRNSGVLESSIYYLKGLSKSHSKELFCRYALNQPSPSPDFKGLVKRFVKSCDGLPLSLKVFGALVSGQNESYWKQTLNELEEILPETEIQDSLRISYDKLSSNHQQIFLDIASFFIGEERDTAIRIWGLRGIENLQDKCLLEVGAENSIRMHDHFRDLARNIAQGLKIRRLWEQSTMDIDVLLEQSSREMTEVRGIRMLDSYYFEGWLNSSRVMPKARRKRRRDGACGISNLQFVATGASYYLEPILKKARSPNLRWLRWYDCPDSCLPSWIPMENLRVLEVKGTNIESLWEEESRAPLQLRELYIQTVTSISSLPKSIGQLQYLEKISIIMMGSTNSLKSLPEEFCELRSLKYLCLEGCSDIISLPNSFGRLTNLQHIDLAGASSLRMLPESFGALTQLKSLDLTEARLQMLPESFGALTQLESLDLSGTRLQMLPESFGALTQLESLGLGGARLQMLPESFGALTRLESLDLCGCTKLTLSSATLGNITTLESLDISHCRNVRELPPQIEHQRSLKVLRMDEANLKKLPNWIGNLCNLETLFIGNYSLKVLPPRLLSNLRSLKNLYIFGAPRLKYLPTRFPRLFQLEDLFIQNCGIEYLPQHLLKMNNLACLRMKSCPLRQLPFGKIEEERERGRKLKFVCMLALKEIDLFRTDISEVFFPKYVCPNLQRLSLKECKKLTQIGGLCGLSKLKELSIDGCVRLEELPNLEMLISLELLYAYGCKRLRSIPGLGQLKKLRILAVSECSEMLELSGAKDLMLLKRLEARSCPKLRWGEGEVEHLRQRLEEGLLL